MAQVATTKSLSSLTAVLQSPSWQTFLTIAEEQGTFPFLFPPLLLPSLPSRALANPPLSPRRAAPALPSRDYPNGNSTSSDQQQPQTFDDGFEIPPDVDVPPEQQNHGDGGDVDMDGGNGGGGAAGAAGGVCPHCTFENEPGARDCDVCGLPIA